MNKVGAMLDFIEESLPSFAIKLGASEESLKVHSLKSHVQAIIVTIGDLIEQHPKLALTLLFILMAELGVFEFLFTQVLSILGFSILGPVKGSFAACIQGWLFPSAALRYPKG